MADLPSNNGVTYFAETDFRGRRSKFGIKDDDRSRHVYVIGKTGMGKSTMLENMAVQDIQNGHGLCFIDPHGGSADKLLEYVPESRIKDVIYFAPFDLENPISFNVMEDVGKDQRHLVVAGLMSAFKKIWVDAWSARMEYILNNTLLALLEYPGSTLLGVNRMLADKDFRKKVVEQVTDPGVKSFWVDEFAKYTDRFAAEATPAIQNKIGQFTSNPLIRNIIGQPKSSFDFRQVMDEQKILIVNLSKGRMGEGNANLIGSMLITKIYLAAMSRANAGAAEMRRLPPFYLFVDEFQSFANESFANILSEARKYKLALTMAHQYVEQMSEEVRDAVFGNVGTTIAFRVGPLDAEVFERLFGPTFMKEDMVNLGQFQMYLTLMIDAVGSPPFSALALPPIAQPLQSFKDQIIENSRHTFARPRLQVEEEIVAWHAPSRVESAPRPVNGSDRPRMDMSRPVAARQVEPPRFPRNEAPRPRPPVVAPPSPNISTQPLAGVGAARPLIPKAVSLSALKNTTPEKASGKHAADLRQVLQEVQKEVAAAMPKSPVRPVVPPPPLPVSPKPPEPKVEPKTEPKIDAKKKEVPEDVLRKMLEV